MFEPLELFVFLVCCRVLIFLVCVCVGAVARVKSVYLAFSATYPTPLPYRTSFLAEVDRRGYAQGVLDFWLLLPPSLPHRVAAELCKKVPKTDRSVAIFALLFSFFSRLFFFFRLRVSISSCW